MNCLKRHFFLSHFKKVILLRPLSSMQTNQSRFKVGDTVSITKRITKDDVTKFVDLSGDSNPIHLQEGQQRAVVHGALLNGLVSGLIGTKLPGPGTLVLSQTLNFPNKCYVDELVTVNVELVEFRKIIKVNFVCEVDNKVVLYGDAKLIMTKQ